MENKGIIRDKMHHFDEEYEDVGHGAMESHRRRFIYEDKIHHCNEE